MMERAALEQIVEEIAAQVTASLPPPPPGPAPEGDCGAEQSQRDAVRAMMDRTPARIGVGKAGARLTTKTLLSLRADHAVARDAVYSDVDPGLPQSLGLLCVRSRCRDREQFITRPDLGRQLEEGAAEQILAHCGTGNDVQLIAADGLSSRAVEANLAKILPVLRDGLEAAGIRMGKPLFVRYGRVAVEDAVAELTGAKLVCILIGERPGLGTAESMSAYLCHGAKVGQPESRRTVVSNIYRGGTPAVEAGAYIVELIRTILRLGKSGVELRQAQEAGL